MIAVDAPRRARGRDTSTFSSKKKRREASTRQNGPFSPKPARLPFFKVNTGVSIRADPRHFTSPTAGFADGGGFGMNKKKDHSLHDATRNGPVLLSPRKRQKIAKKTPAEPVAAAAWILWNFLGLLRVTACHRAHGRKNSADVIVRVSVRAKNGRQRRPVAENGRQRRPVQHNNNSNIKVNRTSAFLGTTHQAQHHHTGIVPVSGALCRISLHQKELHRARELRRVTRVRIQKRGC